MPGHVRELILDSDPEILDVLVFGREKKWRKKSRKYLRKENIWSADEKKRRRKKRRKAIKEGKCLEKRKEENCCGTGRVDGMKEIEGSIKDVLTDLNWCDCDFQVESVFGGLSTRVWRHFAVIKEIVHSQHQPPA